MSRDLTEEIRNYAPLVWGHAWSDDTVDWPADLGEWFHPSYVVAVDDAIVFGSPSRPLPSRWWVRAGPSMLTDFLELGGADAEQVAAYARRWGPLWVCDDHALPVGHAVDGSPLSFGGEPCRAIPKVHWLAGGDTFAAGGEAYVQVPGGRLRRFRSADDLDLPEGWWWVEPVDAWRRLAGRMRALLLAAARLLDEPDRPLPEETWVQARQATPTGTPPRGAESAVAESEAQQQVLGRVLEGWLVRAPCTMTVEWPTGAHPRWSMTPFGLAGLFGALVFQMVGAFTTRALVGCDGCGRFFEPTRRPQPDRRTFCPECRERGVPGKLASQAYRERQRRRGTSSGRSMGE